MEKNTQLTISVIIPMYNASKTIIRALDSVKNQTYRCHYQLLVVNDGSEDNSQQVVEEYISQNSELDISLINQSNSGVSKARNNGLKNAMGDYIALLDSDDEWVKDKIERQMNIFQTYKEVDFVVALRNNEKIYFPYKLIKGCNHAEVTLRKLLLKVVGQTSTALFRNKILVNTGYFDENQKYSEDANYWMRISQSNKMVILNETLVFTNNDYGGSGLSSNIVAMEQGVKKNIKEMYSIKAINSLEYIFFVVFAELKYLIRKLKK